MKCCRRLKECEEVENMYVGEGVQDYLIGFAEKKSRGDSTAAWKEPIFSTRRSKEFCLADKWTVRASA